MNTGTVECLNDIRGFGFVRPSGCGVGNLNHTLAHAEMGSMSKEIGVALERHRLPGKTFIGQLRIA